MHVSYWLEHQGANLEKARPFGNPTPYLSQLQLAIHRQPSRCKSCGVYGKVQKATITAGWVTVIG